MVMKINVDKYKDVIQHILIDDREQSRKEYAMEQYASFNPLICHLDYGDYIFVGNNGVKVVWEYKTGSDFLSSINSETHHLHNQVFEMTTQEDYTFVIVECVDLLHELDELYFNAGISLSLQQINGAIAEYCTVSTVLQVQTEYQAFDLMMRTSAKIILEKPYRWKFGKKSTNWALNILGFMKGLDNQAENICRQLDLHTLDDVMNLTKSELMSVDGIGEKKADKILNNIREWSE